MCAFIWTLVVFFLKWKKHNAEEKALGLPGRTASRVWLCKLRDLKKQVIIIFKKKTPKNQVHGERIKPTHLLHGRTLPRPAHRSLLSCQGLHFSRDVLEKTTQSHFSTFIIYIMFSRNATHAHYNLGDNIIFASIKENEFSIVHYYIQWLQLWRGSLPQSCWKCYTSLGSVDEDFFP